MAQIPIDRFFTPFRMTRWLKVLSTITMAKIVLDTIINAPIEIVFDLSRSIDMHIESTKQTGEQAIAGRKSGLIELGETVTWRAKHFGIWQSLTSKITDYNYPTFLKW